VVGIDATTDLPKPPGFFAFPGKEELTLVVDRELTDDTIFAISRELRKRTKRKGKLEAVGNSFSWIADGSTPVYEFEGRSRGGKSELKISLNPSEHRSMAYMIPGLLLGLMTFGFVDAGNFSALPAMIVFVSMIFLVAHLLYRSSHRKKLEIARDILEESKQIILREGDGESNTESESSERRIDLNESEGYSNTETLSEPAATKTSKRRIP